jgi:hypothetical protein
MTPEEKKESAAEHKKDDQPKKKAPSLLRPGETPPDKKQPQ